MGVLLSSFLCISSINGLGAPLSPTTTVPSVVTSMVATTPPSSSSETTIINLLPTEPDFSPLFEDITENDIQIVEKLEPTQKEVELFEEVILQPSTEKTTEKLESTQKEVELFEEVILQASTEKTLRVIENPKQEKSTIAPAFLAQTSAQTMNPVIVTETTTQGLTDKQRLAQFQQQRLGNRFQTDFQNQPPQQPRAPAFSQQQAAQQSPAFAQQPRNFPSQQSAQPGGAQFGQSQQQTQPEV